METKVATGKVISFSPVKLSSFPNVLTMKKIINNYTFGLSIEQSPFPIKIYLHNQQAVELASRSDIQIKTGELITVGYVNHNGNYLTRLVKINGKTVQNVPKHDKSKPKIKSRPKSEPHSQPKKKLRYRYKPQSQVAKKPAHSRPFSVERPSLASMSNVPSDMGSDEYPYLMSNYEDDRQVKSDYQNLVHKSRPEINRGLRKIFAKEHWQGFKKDLRVHAGREINSDLNQVLTDYMMNYIGQYNQIPSNLDGTTKEKHVKQRINKKQPPKLHNKTIF